MMIEHASPRSATSLAPRPAPVTGWSPLLLMLVAAAAWPTAATAQKRALDHDAYDQWMTIQGEQISDGGGWVLYQLSPRVGDSELVVTRPMGQEIRVPRGDDARFSPDDGFAVFTIEPAHDSVRALRLQETRQKDMPTDTLGILSLETRQVMRIADVRSWQLPERGRAVVAYLVSTEPDSAAADTADAEEAEREKPQGHTLVLRDLASGTEHRYDDVVEYELSEDGSRLAFTTSTEGGAGDGLHVVDPATGEQRTVLSGEGLYEQLAVSEDGRQVAVLSDRDQFRAEQPAFALYAWREGRETAERIADGGTAGVPQGWWVSQHGELEFSASGDRLFFGTAPRPAPEPEQDSLLDEERVELDVWHWQDPLLQPMQLLEADEERERTYVAVAHLEDGNRVVQLATPELPDVDLANEGDSEYALAETGVPYRHLVGIESPGFSDLWLVDVGSGNRWRVLRNRQLSWSSLSPEGERVAWYDYADGHWYSMSARDRQPTRVSAGVPFPLWDEEDDHPMPPGPYGMAGWTEGAERLLVYDRYDVWALDPEGREQPRRITEGYGRDNLIRLRHVDLDEEDRGIDPDASLLLSAFHTDTKDDGFYRDRVRGQTPPQRLLMAPKRFGDLEKADDTDVLLYTRQDVAEFPDLWVASTSFESPRKVSDANPQQSEYNWATVELVEWLSTDGIPHQGLLYRPEDFDPSREYPMMVTFYERDSHNLHEHSPPLPHRSVIQPTFYASRGYIVFVPDVIYDDGFPGESAMNSIMPGVLMVAEEPWVDEDNVGVQGHSWGGYQIAYMITQTDFFKAAEAGAPVANMTSAYGGIRWGSGMSRMFQYERTQSRIGESLWDNRLRYIENSPLFFLDEVETPLLIMHNDEDGAVPWEQGIELFVALRRLDKPVWMINYNDQPHWPVTAANIRDWNIRMQQFFDHFLKGAPAPVWLARGIPAVDKGRTLGLEPVEVDPSAANVTEESGGGF